MEFIIAQLVGFIALAFSITVFQKNKRRLMLLLQMSSAFLFAIHFALLGAWTGSAMNFVNTLRSYIFANKGNKYWANNKVWVLVFILLFSIFTLITWQGWISLLPLIAMISGTIAFWLDNPRHIRLLSLISPPAWFIYNLTFNSYPGMIIEVLLFLSIIIGIFRFDIIAQKKFLNLYGK